MPKPNLLTEETTLLVGRLLLFGTQLDREAAALIQRISTEVSDEVAELRATKKQLLIALTVWQNRAENAEARLEALHDEVVKGVRLR